MKAIISLTVAMSMAGVILAVEPVVVTPAASISLGARHGHVVPTRQGFTHTGGGNIDITQPAPDTLVVNMCGVTVAGGHPCKCSSATMNFDLDQCLDITSSVPGPVKVTIESRVVGALRSHKTGGTAQEGPGTASLCSGNITFATLNTPIHSVSCGDNMSINCRTEPYTFVATPGRVNLRQNWSIATSHPQNVLPCKAASSEFAPDPALDPLWISYWEPFHGAIKKDFGFQVILKVAPANGAK